MPHGVSGAGPLQLTWGMTFQASRRFASDNYLGVPAIGATFGATVARTRRDANGYILYSCDSASPPAPLASWVGGPSRDCSIGQPHVERSPARRKLHLDDIPGSKSFFDRKLYCFNGLQQFSEILQSACQKSGRFCTYLVEDALIRGMLHPSLPCRPSAYPMIGPAG
jgi:hypothetical protein